jgi:hypothetical protein
MYGNAGIVIIATIAISRGTIARCWSYYLLVVSLDALSGGGLLSINSPILLNMFIAHSQL